MQAILFYMISVKSQSLFAPKLNIFCKIMPVIANQ